MGKPGGCRRPRPAVVISGGELFGWRKSDGSLKDVGCRVALLRLGSKKTREPRD